MRTRAASHEVKEYFDSWEELISYRTNQLPFSIPSPLKERVVSSSTSRLLVCHDYKGGYSEQYNVRGYTFDFWYLIHEFTYFSHHQITLPPSAWTETAHKFGVEMLGTLIFEHNSTPQLQKLLADDSVSELLIQLTLDHGFDGYLINVEISTSPEVANRLRIWVDNFRSKMAAHGKVVTWYDAITIQGDLQWQNRLSPQNQPFFDASSSIFLNYSWQKSFPLETLETAGTRGKDVYFGIDVFGRGQYGGGGFESARALDVIHSAAKPAGSENGSPPSLSVALFGIGWTHEGIDHSLESKSAFAEFKKDDRYFWIGGDGTKKVVEQRLKILNERRQVRGYYRAVKLGKLVGDGQRAGIEEFDYKAPFEEFPELLADKPISDYYATNSMVIDKGFYTNFSSSSGFDLFLNGNKVFQSQKGWTDIEFHWPPADKAISKQCSIHEDDAWNGPCSLLVENGKESLIRLCSISLAAKLRSTITATVIWKSLNGSTTLEISLPPLDEKFTQATTASENDWVSTTFIFEVTSFTRINSFDIRLEPNSKILLGSLFLTKSTKPSSNSIYNLHFTRPSILNWKSAGNYLYFTIWIDSEESEDLKFIGTSFKNQFDVGNVQSGETIFVRGVLEDGRLEEWDLAESISIL